MKDLNSYLNIFGRILALAGLWFIGGYMFGAALETIGYDGYRLSLSCASLNVILGMAFFKNLIRYRFIDEAFFKGTAADQPGYSIVRGLWLLPLLGVIFGASMWFWAIILRWLFRE